MTAETQHAPIARYQIIERIGAGGMGVVYRAVDRLTGDTVALKRVTAPGDHPKQSARAGSTDYRLALAQEFKFLASLRHPNIISVLDYGFDEDRQPYFTMDYMPDAHSILEAGQDQPLNVQVGLLAQMVQALAYLHRGCNRRPRRDPAKNPFFPG